MDRDDIQAVVEVFPELASLDLLREIGVGRRDHPHVDLDRVVSAYSFELPFLQRAQQLGLQIDAHRGDLVEKQRAPVRLFKPAFPVGDGARERAADMAEQLRFEQCLRDGAAVEGDEVLAAPRTVVVDRAGHEFFPCAGLAGDQNRARGAGHRLEQLSQSVHWPALTDNSLEPVALLELRSKVLVLRAESPALERRRQRVQ